MASVVVDGWLAARQRLAPRATNTGDTQTGISDIRFRPTHMPRLASAGHAPLDAQEDSGRGSKDAGAGVLLCHPRHQQRQAQQHENLQRETSVNQGQPARLQERSGRNR